MHNSITLGQYYPVKSPLHSLDGRMRIFVTLIYMIMAFVCNSAASFLMLALFSLVLIFISRVPFGVIMKSIRAILIILLITFIMNVFFYTSDAEPLFEWWIFRLYTEGIVKAFMMAVRITALVAVSCLMMSYTATPIDITHSIEAIFEPIKFLREPIHSFSMMMFIALRFIPTLTDDTDRILTAQKSRGADLSEGSLFARIRNLTAIMIPLFVSSFRRADELAIAMECRCYHGGEGRTRMRTLHYRASDFVILALFVVYAAAVVWLNSIKIFGY